MTQIDPASLKSNPFDGMDINILRDRRQALTREQLELEKQGCPYNPTISEGANAIAQHQHQDKLRSLILEQLQIMAALRKTSSGPAKAGGKRAKRAPLDLAALEDEIFNAIS